MNGIAPMLAALPALATSANGGALALALFLPIVASLGVFLAGGRFGARIAAITAPIGLLLAVWIVASILETEGALVLVVGDWTPPLGVALRADGFSAAMLLTTALIMTAVIFFSQSSFPTPRERVTSFGGIWAEGRAQLSFWVLLLGLWAALNAVFLSNDLFSIYVAIELLTFTAIPLVCVAGGAETVGAALRYLLFALLGSLLYLLGVALMYGAYGTLDITLLATVVADDPTALIAVALMTVGMLAKTALFPLHLWLPPAHGGAPPAASAVLSSLVVKGSFFVIFRIWLELLGGFSLEIAAQLVAALGAMAILFGSVMALRQERLKLLIAYSTVAQIGYLFLVLPLVTVPAAMSADRSAVATAALTGGLLQAISHACAKAAMFLSAGLIAETLGHDRIGDSNGVAGVRGVGRTIPLTVFAFLIGGLSLMGLPPSGGFWAKWLLLSAAINTGQWWWAMVMIAGGLLAGGYVFRVIGPAFASTDTPERCVVRVSRGRQLVVLGLAIFSMLLGLMALTPPGLLETGRSLPIVEAHR